MKSEFFRYFVVSTAALLADFIVFSFGIRLLNIPWPLSATCGFIIGVLVAYFLSVRFVFSRRKLRAAPLRELLVFSAVGLAGLALTQITLWIGIELLQFNPEFSKICAAGFTFVFNFLVRKFILFSGTDDQ